MTYNPFTSLGIHFTNKKWLIQASICVLLDPNVCKATYQYFSAGNAKLALFIREGEI